MNLAGVAVREHNFARAAELLKETYPKPGEEDLRGWEWHAIFRMIHTDVRVATLPQAAEVVSLNPLRVVENDPDSPPALRTLDPDTLLDRALEHLFRMFPQAERGLVVSRDDPEAPLVLRTVRTGNRTMLRRR